MVNRDNYLTSRSYLEYLRDVRQLKSRSIDRYWAYLKHLLLWADEALLSDAPAIRPTFPTYLSSTRPESHGDPLAPATVRKIIQTAKRFFHWCLVTFTQDFRGFPRSWIDTLQPPRAVIQQPQEHEFVTLEEVRALIARDPGDDMALRRDQAAAALLFLSGMRASAFASLPVEAIDLDSWSVKQWPSLGVRTKNGKAATTYLLDIPDLREAVADWDAVVRPQLPLSAAWYAPIISEWGDQFLSSDRPGKNRGQAVNKRLRKLFEKAGVPYQSAHRFRHGHAVFALQHAKTMADYKAVSMNLMHSDIRVTDSIYAPLAGDDVRQRIAGLTGEISNHQDTSPDSDLVDRLRGLSDAELAQLLKAAAERLAR